MTNIALWNGESWTPLWSGLNGVVYALAVFNGDLIAAGSFTAADGVPMLRIARWDGSSWQSLGGGMDSTVNALAVFESNLIAAGKFTTADGGAANRIARWDGVSWSPLGSGVNGEVRALLDRGADLVVAGDFTAAGGNTANRIAKWDGTWGTFGTGLNNSAVALSEYGGDIYAGGYFNTAGGAAVNRIARWDGVAWHAVGSGLDSYCYSMAIHDGLLYVGGNFNVAGDIYVSKVAAWNGASWSPADGGQGIARTEGVYSLVEHEGALYLGGSFSGAGGAVYPLSHIAKWNGAGWERLGEGLDDSPFALVSWNGYLVATGSFISAGGVSANRIASWDGSAWSPMGLGLNAPGRALAVFDGDLIVGGDFSVAGSASPANYIARWDGVDWHALGSGVDSSVEDLAVYDGSLYARGGFTTAGGVSVQGFARWDGITWSAVPGASYPYSMCAHDTLLFCHTTDGIQAFDGAAWIDFPEPLDWLSSNTILLSYSGTFTMLYSELYSSTGAYASSWNGCEWQSLGSPYSYLDGSPICAVAMGAQLFVGGGFNHAMGTPSSKIALYEGPVNLCSIDVLAPGNGAVLCAGEPAVVEWETGGDCVSSVLIELLHAGAVCDTLAEAAPNSGSFELLPAQCAGHETEYSIRITEVGGEAVGTSGGTFSILSGGLLQVLSPNGGNTLFADSQATISWSHNACCGPTVSLELRRGGEVCQVIAAATENDGQYTWLVGQCGVESDGYSLRVADDVSGAVDESDSSFVIRPAFGIDSIDDVGGDQGRQVRIQWPRQQYDDSGEGSPITSYSVWRRIDVGLKALSSFEVPEPLKGPGGEALFYPPGEWDCVSWIPACAEESYSVVCPTLCDSTVVGGLHWSVFFVRAHTSAPSVFYDTPPDSGYSLDNIAPAAPANVHYEASTVVAWDPVDEEDLALYRIYATDELGGGTKEVLGETADTSYDLGALLGSYLAIVAVDQAGNESRLSELLSPTGVGQNLLPRSFAIYPSAPNPFNPQTTIRYDLPEDCRVDLHIHDVAGRLIRTLADNEMMSAGRQKMIWNGRDEAGHAVAAGTYFCRLAAGGYRGTIRMTLVK